MQGLPVVEDCSGDANELGDELRAVERGVPSSQSCMLAYIAAATRMSKRSRTAMEKLGHHGGRAAL